MLLVLCPPRFKDNLAQMLQDNLHVVQSLSSCSSPSVHPLLGPLPQMSGIKSGCGSGVVMMSLQCHGLGGGGKRCPAATASQMDESWEFFGTKGRSATYTPFLQTVASTQDFYKRVCVCVGGVMSQQRGSLWQSVSVYGLDQAWCAVACWECWQILCIFSGLKRRRICTNLHK